MSPTVHTPRGRTGPIRPRPRGGRVSYRPAPDPRTTRPKGLSTLWTRVRRLIWSWWPWAAYSVYLISEHNWWGAFGVGLWSGICSLSTPAEQPPQYGFEHGLTVGSPEFLETMAGAAGVPFLPGNKFQLLNNGDAFYPVMLKAIREAERSITVEAYIYWAGEIGMTLTFTPFEARSANAFEKAMPISPAQ